MLTPSSLQAQSVSPEILDRVRNACVFIRSDFGEGSGFLTTRNDEYGILVTAAHVLVNREQVTRSIKAYFQSGNDNEVALTPMLLGLDLGRDVAFLRIPADKLPEPLTLAPDAPISETMDVVLAGFPYGGQLAIRNENPALTISKGVISSVRMGKLDTPAVIQLDANVNPGNSGGPVLNTKGEVIGMVWAKVDGTQLGFATPAHAVVDGLMGDVASYTLEDYAGKGGMRRYVLKGKLVDPLNRIREVRVQLGSLDEIPDSMKSAKQWPSLPHKADHAVALRKGGSLDVEFPLPITDVHIEDTFLQLVCTREDGSVVYSAPRSVKRVRKIVEPDARSDRPSESPPATVPNPPARPPFSKPDKSMSITVGTVPRNQLLRPQSMIDEQVPGSLLSKPMPSGNYTIRRLYISETTVAPHLVWSESGDRLALVGEEITVIDYPEAKHVQAYRFAVNGKSAYFQGDNLYVAGRDGEFLCLDLKQKKVTNQWSFSSPVDPFPLAPSSSTEKRDHGWLMRASDPLRGNLTSLFQFDGRDVSGEQPLSFTNDVGALGAMQNMVVTRSGQGIFAVSTGHLYRFAYGRDKPTFSEGTALVGIGFPDVRLLDSTDDQVVLLMALGNESSDFHSQLAAYAASNLRNNYIIDVPEHLHCAVRDKVSGRVFAGGIDSLWIWTPRTRELEKHLLPESAACIDALAMHPSGSQLAILCGANTGYPQLYWLDVSKSPSSNK